MPLPPEMTVHPTVRTKKNVPISSVRYFFIVMFPQTNALCHLVARAVSSIFKPWLSATQRPYSVSVFAKLFRRFVRHPTSMLVPHPRHRQDRLYYNSQHAAPKPPE